MDDSLRAADRDRDQVLEALREHYSQGRLTMEEYDERTTAATSAKTMGDLRTLTVDLPALSEPSGSYGPPDQRAWTPQQMRWIAVAGIAATGVVVALLTVFGHFVFAVPTWLVVLVAIRAVHGKRRMPHERRHRPRRY